MSASFLLGNQIGSARRLLQFLRFAVIGVVLNTSLFLAYLVLTGSGLGNRAAMTLTYVAGVLLGFVLNRRITFRFSGGMSGALGRYIAAYLIGYGINWFALWVFVDHLGLAHQVVQVTVTICLPTPLFLLLRYWVFPARALPQAAFS